MKTATISVGESGNHVNPHLLPVEFPEEQTETGTLAEKPEDEEVREIKVTLEEAQKVINAPAPIPAVEKKDILVFAASGPKKKEEMLKAQGERFDAAVREHRCTVEQHHGRTSGDLLGKLDRAIKRTAWEKGNTDKAKVVRRPVVRYTWESAGLVVASMLLLGIGANTLATILLSSGLPGFDHSIRAYLFSFVPVGLSLGAVGLYCLLPEVRRAAYARAVWVLGLVCGTTWVILFARIFSDFGRSAEAVLQAVLSGRASAASAESSLSSPVLIACGVLAEIFLAAGCSISARRACRVVEEGQTRKNQDYIDLAAKLAELSELRGRLNVVADSLKARLEHLTESRKDFLNRAGVFFDLSVENVTVGGKAASLVAALALFLSGTVEAGAAPASRLIVGASPELPAAKRQAAEATIIGLLITNGWTGRIDVEDARASTNVANFAVPKAGLGPAGRMRVHAPAIGNLRSYLRGATNDATEEMLIPQFLQHVATHVRLSNEPLDVLLIGSALYRDKETGFNMVSNLVPSDDHIFASMGRSPYGTQEWTGSNRLAGVRVHIICRQADYTSKAHFEATADFWNNWVQALGGRLVSYDSDFHAVLERVIHGVPGPYRTVKPAPIGRLSMLAVIGKEKIPVEETGAGSRPADVAALMKQATNAVNLEARLKDVTNDLAKLTAAARQAEVERAASDEAKRLQIRAKAQATHDASIAAGDTAASPETMRPLYQLALLIARTNGLDTSIANGRLKAIEPAELPPGVTAELVRVSTDNYPPCLGLELAVEVASGQPLVGLADKDFSILLNGRRATVRTAVVPTVGQAAQPLTLVIALDCSGSMHPAMAQAKAALVELLTGFGGRANFRFKILSFADKPGWVFPDWTSDTALAARRVSGLKAGGNTALYNAIGEAIDALKDQPGDRRLIVLTDGNNTERTLHSPASLAAALKKAGIVACFIGLKTKELDTAVLAQMAAQAGGSFQMAGRAEELRRLFSEAGRRLMRPAYRLVVTPKACPTNSAALSVFVGTGPTMVSLNKGIQLPANAAVEAPSR